MGSKKKLTLSLESAMEIVSDKGMFVISIAITLTIACIVLIWKRRNGTSFKGAPVWPVVGILPSMIFHFGHVHSWLTHLAIVNRGTFRVHGSFKIKICTADPANIEYVLKTKHHNFGKGDYFRDILRDLVGESLLVQDGEHFKMSNKSMSMALLSTGFRSSAAITLPSLITQKLLPVLNQACEKGTIVDLQNIFVRLAYDIMCIFSVGVDPGSLSLDLDRSPFLEAFDETTQWVLFRMCMPSFCWKMLRYLNVGRERRFLKARDCVYEFINKEVYPRWLADSDDDNGILSTFFRLERESGRVYSYKRKLQSIVNLLLAGKDSVSAGLTWFFWLVAQHPRVEANILAELRGILKQRETLHTPSFSIEEVKQMQYLHAAVTESLRLYPPNPVEVTEAEQDDILPDGTPVEKGALLVYLIYSSGRLESVWGSDCREFKPERWLNINGEFVRESEFKFLVFNGGPRRCTGREFAYFQMKLAAAAILIRYRINIAEKYSPLPSFGLALSMKQGLRATLLCRDG
ncbi:hypothetical protein KI387_030986 [Taxus chinensis]|uniref:Cytochrome P450 n=1 Tax=Taxus chinensis TaxID=29808 RepID=A0AA38FB48_TAXCH|nr:hypothetical protein KI387_030986 [Taxus chinensis]